MKQKAKSKGFTAEEQAAMKERLQELKAEGARTGRGGRAKKTDGESAMLEKLAELAQPDRSLGERLHALIKANAPVLEPRTWYGMPAYAKGGDVVCFFQSAQKFKTRYCTLGFSHWARLDEGEMWATSFAVTELTPAVEKQIVALLKRAIA
jgi:uncharacterized protein YdhG (YjbR/CyaY superfamily)